ncbi:MAG: NrsF family protein [Candidatus Binatia bacterium]
MTRSDHRDTIERLVEDAVPVRPLAPALATMTRWGGLVLGLCALGIASGGLDRLTTSAADPMFVAQLAALLVAAIVASVVALHAVVPGEEPNGWRLLAACLACAPAVVTPLLLPAERPVDVAHFAAAGIECAAVTLAAGLVLFAALAIAVRRGTPFRAGAAALFAGTAALSAASMVARLRCPAEERWHVLAWHLVPVVIGLTIVALTRTRWWQAGRPSNPIGDTF